MKTKNISVIMSISLLLTYINAFSNITDIQPGIKIVSTKEIDIRNDMYGNGFSKTQMNTYKLRSNQRKVKGYIEEDSQRAKDLLKMKNNYYYEFNSYNENNKFGTDLKRNLDNIKLAFKYSVPSSITKDNILGYAVYGTYLQGPPNEGWTGIATYFNQPNIGVCHYILNNAKLNHSGVELLDINVIYDVNKKPTEIIVNGNNQTGYLYVVEWYDSNYFHTLECANGQYDRKLTEKTVEFAKLIDKEVK